MAMSSVWSEGYVTDTLYTDHVFREQSPVWINHVAGLHGCVPRPLDKPFAYLELGCGLGHSLTVLAAALPNGHFIGVDFNPAHIDHAQRRARELGLANITFIEASFQDLAADSSGSGIAREIGQVDFVALHGIYSWISADARAAVQKIIFDRLLPGGLVYNSYNCLPGWSMEAPLQRLMKEFALSGNSGSLEGMRHALSQLKSLAETKQGYFSQAQVANAVTGFAKKSKSYLAHEFLNGTWQLFYSSDVAADMAAAKLDFVGSATLIENHLDLILPEAAQAAINKLSDPRQRQLLQDYLVNQRFRRDVFVRGHARLDRGASTAIRLAQFLVAPKSLGKLIPTIKVARSSVNFDAARFKHLIAAIDDRGGRIGDIATAFGTLAGTQGDVLRMINVLAAAGHLQPAAQAPHAGHAYSAGRALGRHELLLPANRVELANAIARRGSAVLASPVLGNATALNFREALLLDMLLAGGGTIETLAASLEQRFKAAGLTFGRIGAGPSTDKQPPSKVDAEQFVDATLPSLVHLGLVMPSK